MRHLWGLSWHSLLNRRYTVLLTVAALAVSVALLIGVEKLRHEIKAGFAQTISGTDLIVGARSSPLQLLLYSVFHMGNATNNVSWESYREIADNPNVAWTVPIALGDSHKGYRVMGTSTAFFEHYRYAQTRRIEFRQGQAFDDVFDAVLGAEVARTLGYELGEQIVLSHGVAAVSFTNHADKPFTVVGILKRTGTPVDRAVLISLAGIEAIHVDWQNGGPPRPGQTVSAEQARAMTLTPDSITAFLVGLKTRIATFRLQRAINQYPDEALSAALPGVALSQLWNMLGMVEKALLAISGLVVLAGVIGMLTSLLTSLNERRREMAILRAVGARPVHVFLLFIIESGLIGLCAVLLGAGLVYGGLWLGQDLITARLGLALPLNPPGASEWALAGGVWLVTLLAGAIPAWRAYRLSLADGLNLRV